MQEKLIPRCQDSKDCEILKGYLLNFKVQGGYLQLNHSLRRKFAKFDSWWSYLQLDNIWKELFAKFDIWGGYLQLNYSWKELFTFFPLIYRGCLSEFKRNLFWMCAGDLKEEVYGSFCIG